MTFKPGDWVRTKPMKVTGTNENGTIAGCYSSNDVFIDDFFTKDLELIALLPEVKTCECCGQEVRL